MQRDEVAHGLVPGFYSIKERGIVPCPLRHFCSGDAMDAGKFLVRVHHERRLASFAPMRNGCEVGRVGLHEQTIEGRGSRSRPSQLRLLERDDPGEADVEPHFQVDGSLIGSASEAVDHAADATDIHFFEDANGVFVCLSDVHHHRPMRLDGQVEKVGESSLLDVGGTVHVMIVEPDFTHRLDPRGLRDDRPDSFEDGVIDARCLVRMHSDGGVEPGPVMGQCHRIVESVRFGGHDADAGDSCLGGPLQHVAAIFFEAFVVEVGVGVEESHVGRLVVVIRVRFFIHRQMPFSPHH